MHTGRMIPKPIKNTDVGVADFDFAAVVCGIKMKRYTVHPIAAALNVWMESSYGGNKRTERYKFSH